MKSTNNHSVWLISECSSGLGRELSKAESTAVGVRDIAMLQDLVALAHARHVRYQFFRSRPSHAGTHLNWTVV